MATLEMLISMGFPEKSVAHAIEVTGNKGVEVAMEWLLAHPDEPVLSLKTAASSGTAGDADAATTEAGDTKMETDGEASSEAANDDGAKSIKCDECGKLFKTNEEVEYHALKSNHSSFSESTEEKVPLTEEQRKEKLIELEQKLKARRREKADEEAKENIEKEKKRIEMGKNVAEIKRKHQEDENRKLAEDKRREKLEDKMARQRVKAMIEADKEARRQKMAAVKGEAPPPVPAATPAPAPAAQPGVKKVYDECRIQFRLPSGTPVIQSFKAKEPLSAVKLWLSLNHPAADPSSTASLSTTFPRKVFSDDEMDMPLDLLGLVPSSVLMVQYK